VKLGPSMTFTTKITGIDVTPRLHHPKPEISGTESGRSGAPGAPRAASQGSTAPLDPWKVGSRHRQLAVCLGLGGDGNFIQRNNKYMGILIG